MVHVLFVSVNAEVHSTTRILQAILETPQQFGISGAVVVPRHGEFVEWLSRRGIPSLVSRLPYPNKWNPISSFGCLGRVALFARRHCVDVIHCNDHDSYPFAVWLRTILRRPLVCHVRYDIGNAFASWAFGRGRCPDALMWNSYYMQRRGGPVVDGIVPVERQHVVRLCIDPTLFSRDRFARQRLRATWNLPEDAIVISTAGVVQSRKRLEHFIEVVERVGTTDPRVHGVIAGNTDSLEAEYVSRILERVHHSSLGSRLRYLGYLSPMGPLLSATDIMVSTSLFETFGNSVAEAMACECPVVAYSGGAVAEVVGNAGFVVENDDVDNLTRCIQMLVKEPGRRRELGQLARIRMVNEFSPNSSVGCLKNVYQSIGVRESL